MYRSVWRRRLRRLRRHPAVRLVVVMMVAAVAVGSMAVAAERVDRAESEWGSRRNVVVATRLLSPGDVVAAADVAVESWPVGLVPASALVDPPMGRTVAARIEEGEPFVAGRLAPAGVSGLAALVPEGARALAVPTTAGTVPLQTGDRVDLLATFTAEIAGGGGAPTFPVATDAVVLDVGDQAVTVAVPEADAARVAFAVSTGTVIPALRGGGDG